MTQFASTYKKQLLAAIDSIELSAVESAVELFRKARDAGHQIFVCGNGGSAATASHFVCDVLKGASSVNKKRFRILALNESIATITAYSNDVSYDYVFVEQLKNFVNRGDLFIAISGSGSSRNVVKAMEFATVQGCRTIALTGRDGGKLGTLAELHVNVAEPHMGRIEDVHLVICHMIAYAMMDPAVGYPSALNAAVSRTTSSK